MHKPYTKDFWSPAQLLCSHEHVPGGYTELGSAQTGCQNALPAEGRGHFSPPHAGVGTAGPLTALSARIPARTLPTAPFPPHGQHDSTDDRLVAGKVEGKMGQGAQQVQISSYKLSKPWDGMYR